jgi:hypothetical protein
MRSVGGNCEALVLVVVEQAQVLALERRAALVAQVAVRARVVIPVEQHTGQRARVSMGLLAKPAHRFRVRLVRIPVLHDDDQLACAQLVALLVLLFVSLVRRSILSPYVLRGPARHHEHGAR